MRRISLRAGYYSALVPALFFGGIVMTVYLPNMGGSGLSLPLNILSWIALCCFALLIIQAPKVWQRYRRSASLFWLYAGCVVLVIRALLTPLPWFNDALIVAIGIVAGLSFYRLLLQLPWRRQHLFAILSTLWIASVLQCVIAVIQLFHLKAAAWWEFPPAQLRPYGIFQQVNVLASFIACGIAATLLLLLYRSKTTRWKRVLLHISLSLQGFVLYACQSQIGYLSTALVILACLGLFWSQRFIIFAAIISLVAGGILSFAVHVWLQFPTVVHTDSTHTRLLIWQHSGQLFSMHPLFGWGVGSFESVFLHQFGGQITNVGIRTVSHPHNEILLWLVEGGIFAAVGMLMLLMAIITLWLNGGRLQRAMLLTASPIALHMMTEFPLYQSAPHWILLIVLLRCADRPYSTSTMPMFMKGIRGGMIFFTVSAIGVLTQTLYLQNQLTTVERNGTQYELPSRAVWQTVLQQDRYEYDRQMGELLRFNHVQDINALRNVEQWAADYTLRHPDNNLYAVRIQIATYLNDPIQAEQLTNEARWLFPADPRWTVNRNTEQP